MDEFYKKFADESQSLIRTAKANTSNESAHWIVSLFDPIPFQAALLLKLEEQDRIDGLEASPGLRDQFIKDFQDMSFDRETIYFNQLKKYTQDRCWSCGTVFKIGSSVYKADCNEHTMCEKHKNTICTKHKRVEAKDETQGDSKDKKVKATGHGGNSNGDETQTKEVDYGNKKSNAHPGGFKIEDIKDFSDSNFVFTRRPKEEVCKIEMADGRELWFHQTDYLERQVEHYAKKAREDDSSDDDIMKTAEGEFRHLKIGA